VRAGERVGQHANAGDAFLQQVSDPARVLLDQPHRVARLEVVGEDEHPDAWIRGPDFLGRDESFVGVGGRHLDVDNRDVGVC